MFWRRRKKITQDLKTVTEIAGGKKITVRSVRGAQCAVYCAITARAALGP